MGSIVLPTPSFTLLIILSIQRKNPEPTTHFSLNQIHLFPGGLFTDSSFPSSFLDLISLLKTPEKLLAFIKNKSKRLIAVKDGESKTPEQSKKEAGPVEQLPLESKLQQLAEQKMKMKLAKKIRLHRKRLVRKRKMRKKGRWPPPKMKS